MMKEEIVMSNDVTGLMFDTFAQIQKMVNQLEPVQASEFGLDNRAGMLYVTDECIFVKNNRRSTLEYYGGFEYVDKESVYTIGNDNNGYTFYWRDDDRVEEAITNYELTHKHGWESRGSSSYESKF